MIHLTSQTKILVAIEAVDFRKQIDSLVRLCKEELARNPRDGTYFVFINRAHTMIRLLSHDGSGYWLCTKRLSQGRYRNWPTGESCLSALEARQLAALIKSSACKAD